MTIGTTLSSVTAEGNGVTTAFTYPFLIPAASDAVVTFVSATGTETQLLTTQYTITGIGNATGGTVTYPLAGGPIAAGSSLTIERVLPLVQTTSLSNQGPTFAAIESALDYEMMCIQQISTTAEYAFRAPTTDPVGLDYVAPPVAQRAGLLAGWDSNGNLIAAATATGALVSAAMIPIVEAASVTAALALLDGIIVFANVAALRAYTGTAPPVVFLAGYYADADGGEGAFAYVSSDTTSADNGGTIFVDADGRRWYRETEGQAPSVKWFGAKGNGSTDDTAAIQAAETTLTAGATLFWPPGTYMVNSTGVTKGGASWLGSGRGVTVVKGLAQTFSQYGYLVQGTSLTGVTVESMAFDTSLITAGADTIMLGFINCTRTTVRNCDFTGMQNYALVFNGATEFWVEDNYIDKPTPANTANQAILTTTSGGSVTQGWITGNHIVGSGTDFSGTDLHICDNVISGWMFGAGVTIEENVSTEQIYITGNTLGGSSGTDVNETVCEGIECWSPYAVIADNLIFSNAGVGISFWGQYTVVTGNVLFNNGQTANSPGIAGGYSSSTQNASYSTVTDNVAFDTQVTKTQTYGYQDGSSSIVRMMIADNNFQELKTAPYDILGSGYDLRMPQLQGFTGTSGGSVTAGSNLSGTATLAGAELGDKVVASCTVNTGGLVLTAWVSSTNSLGWQFYNPTGSTITIGTCDINFFVEKPVNYAAY